MTVTSLIVGAVTNNSARVMAVTDATSARLAVDTDSGFTSPILFAPVTPSAENVADLEASGLLADTEYFYAIEEDTVLETTTTGRFRTAPTVAGFPASFAFAASGDAGLTPDFPDTTAAVLASDRLSNAPTFDTIRTHPSDPLFFTHLGDLHYYDLGSGSHGISGGGSLSNYRRAISDVLLQTRQHQLYRELPLLYFEDDHDGGPNNWDGTLVTKFNFGTAYRERVPSYGLGEDLPGGLSVPGASGEYASTPDHASLDIVGDLDIRGDLSLSDWDGGAATRTVFGKWVESGSQRSYLLRVLTDGTLRFNWSTTGADTLQADSTVPVPFVNGRGAVRVTFDVDNGAGGRTATFYTAPSLAGPWTQLGAAVTTAGVTSIFSGTAQGSVGAYSTGTGGFGTAVIHAAQVRSSIDGTIVANPDFSANVGAASFADSTGKTWTVNGSLTLIAGPTGATYQSFQIGRVLFVVLDTRFYRSPSGDADGPNKTMLGAEQKAWLQALLEDAADDGSAKALVVFSSLQWLGSQTDSWPGYATERTEIGDMFVTTGWADRMMMVCADWHCLAFDSGANNDWGGFPTYVVGSIDATPFTPDPVYDIGVSVDRDQYGIFSIDDEINQISITAEAYQDQTELFSHELVVSVGTLPPPEQLPDVTSLLGGSHDVVYDARVLETFQTGPDPSGTTIDLISGDVEIDGTRDVRSTAKVRTSGTIGQDGPLAFPRGRDRLLAPYGNEVFIRYGFQLGDMIEGGVQWIPLGYFRITGPDQEDAPSNPIELSLEDRMATIIDSDLVTPRVYAPPQTIGDVFDDLILDIYPDATIQFDDATVSIPLARQVIVDESRYKPLKELADSFGKIFYWDTEGICRIENPPDPNQIVWDVRSKKQGTLVNAKRRLSRRGIYNAVVVIGEGADDNTPVRAVAYDNDPLSPTRFGGPLGAVPLTIKTPLVSTQAQADLAARRLLQQALGAPYVVSAEAITNPSLRPGEAIRVTYNNNDRDIHLVDSVTIPLDEDSAMTIETREKAIMIVGFL